MNTTLLILISLIFCVTLSTKTWPLQMVVRGRGYQLNPFWWLLQPFLAISDIRSYFIFPETRNHLLSSIRAKIIQIQAVDLDWWWIWYFWVGIILRQNSVKSKFMEENAERLKPQKLFIPKLIDRDLKVAFNNSKISFFVNE